MPDTIMHVSTVCQTDAPALRKGKKLHRRRRSIFKEFALDATAHGIPRIARSQSVSNRIFWMISFLAFAGIMLYFLTDAILAYFTYPTQTTVNIGNEWPQLFPAFTLCNVSPVRLDRFIQPFLNYTNGLNVTNTNDTTSWPNISINYVYDFLIKTMNEGSSIEEFFFPLSSMLISCSYNNVPCSIKDFISFDSSTYGFCYTFNAKMKNTTDGNVRDSSQNGGNGQLLLHLYIHNHQYVPNLKEGFGMAVMIHDNTELPLVEVVGMQMAPDLQYRLTYTKKLVTSLSSPYSTCTNQIPLSMNAMFDYYQGADYAYSQVLCFTLCEQAYIYDQCGCVSPVQWNARSIVLPGSNNIVIAPLCNISSLCYTAAATVFTSNPSVYTKYCSDCAQQCSITDFNIKASSLARASYWNMNDIKSFVENASQVPLPTDWESEWPAYIRASYLSIEAQRESTLVESYTQAATMSPTDVVSNVGGLTGLWLGMSFLSLVEVAEMLYRLIRRQFYFFRRRATQKTTELN